MELLDIMKETVIATYGYSFEPYKVPEEFRGKLEYTYEKCIGCGACAIVCPSNALMVKYDKKKNKITWDFNCGKCIYCGRCEEVCPTWAIVFSPTYQTAVKFNKNDLKESSEFEVIECEICKKPFTAKRLVNYTIKRLQKSGIDINKKQISYMKTCHECKKSFSVDKSVNYETFGGLK